MQKIGSVVIPCKGGGSSHECLRPEKVLGLRVGRAAYCNGMHVQPPLIVIILRQVDCNII